MMIDWVRIETLLSKTIATSKNAVEVAACVQALPIAEARALRHREFCDVLAAVGGMLALAGHNPDPF